MEHLALGFRPPTYVARHWIPVSKVYYSQALSLAFKFNFARKSQFILWYSFRTWYTITLDILLLFSGEMELRIRPCAFDYKRPSLQAAFGSAVNNSNSR
jgi:hypothetical protein